MLLITGADSRMEALARELRRSPDDGAASKVQSLRDALFEMLERGFWRPGERLPGERELAEYISFSLGTVQAAMRSLAANGLIERRRGAGSFVANAQEFGATVWHFRFRTADGKSLMPIEIRVLSIEETEDRGPWSDFMDASPAFIKISRIVEIGNRFSTYSEVYLDAMRFRPLLDLPPEVLSGKNLRIYLHERFNAPTMEAIHRIVSRPVDAGIASLIGCEAGVPGLYMGALSYTYRNIPFSYQSIVIPPTDYALEILG